MCMVFGHKICVWYLDMRYVYGTLTRDMRMVLGHKIRVWYLDMIYVYGIWTQDMCSNIETFDAPAPGLENLSF